MIPRTRIEAGWGASRADAVGAPSWRDDRWYGPPCMSDRNPSEVGDQRWDRGLLVALGALVTSISAVWIAWDEGSTLRASLRLSHRPILQLGTQLRSGQDPLELSYSVRNVGPGVAVVVGGRLFLGEKGLKTYDELISALFPDDLRSKVRVSGSTLRGHLGPGEGRSLLEFEFSRAETSSLAFAQYIHSNWSKRIMKLRFDLCYCSLFDECWLLPSAAQIRPRRVRRCPVQRDPVEPILDETFRGRAFPRN